MARALRVEILGNASPYLRELRKASGGTETFAGKLGVVGKAAAITAGGAGLGALAIAARRGFDELKEGQLVSAQTAAVLKSTGGAAKVSAGHVASLASSLSRMSGVDDEVVQGGENLLLTFQNVRNEIGNGNDVFDQATKAALNMSVALGTDLSSAARAVGKALNDPVKAIALLHRRGVDFTLAQQDQIKAMVKAGDVIGAQKILLGGLERAYGGSAKAAGDTLPGQLNKLNNAFDELSAKGLQGLSAELQGLAPVFQTIGEAANILGPTLKALGTYVIDNVVAPFKITADLLRGDFSGAWEAAKAPILDLWNLVQTVFGGAASSITSAVEGATAAARDFGAGILQGMKDGIFGFADWVTGRVNAGVQAITDALVSALSTATTFGSNILTGMKTGIFGFADWVWSVATGAVAYITQEIGNALAQATSFGASILAGLKAGIEGFAGWVWSRATGAIAYIVGELGNAYNKAHDFGDGIFRGLKDGVADLAALVSGPLTAAKDFIVGLTSSAFGLMKTLGSDLYEGLKAGLDPIIGFLNGILSLINAITSAGSKGFPNGGSWLNPGGRRAAGGPVRRGASYLVGEVGPELFIPGSSGRIIPNGKLGAAAAGGGGNTYTFNFPNYLGSKDEIVREVQRGLLSYQSANGPGSLGFA